MLQSRRSLLKAVGAAGAGALLVGRGEAQGSELGVGGRPVDVVVSPVSPRTVRISVVERVGGQAGAPPFDGSLVQESWGAPIARIRELPAAQAVSLGKITVTASPAPLTLSVDWDGRRVQRLRVDQQTGQVAFLLGDSPLLGLGEGGPQFDRRGSTDPMRNGQAGYQLRTHGGRVPLQWLIGTGGFALFIHSPYGAFDFTGSEGRFDPGSPGQALPLDVFVVASREPAEIMAEYALLTGKPEPPPLWSFGYLQSHRTLGGPDEVMKVARTFREKKLPCDALIYLGTEFTPSGWNTRNGEFDWHKGNFPEPKKMIDELHAGHFKVALHVVIEGRRMDGTVHDSCRPDKTVPSGRTPDGKWPEDRNVAWRPSRRRARPPAPCTCPAAPGMTSGPRRRSAEAAR
jgi:hypothetical protein